MGVYKLPRLARVLVGDDDRSVRDAVARTLRQQGSIVDVVADGAEALSLASEFPYAVVVADYRMPGLSGVELIQALQAIRPDSTFVILTAVHEAAQGLGRIPQVPREA